MFQKATKHKALARIALAGPSGSGKTFTALNIAKHLGKKVAFIDTERGSASKYADLFNFDVLELDTFHPQKYIDAIKEAEVAGYDTLIIDSLSHAWMGKDGALELVDRVAKRSPSANSYAAWREVTPLHNALVDAMLECKMHVIVTMRSKTAYSQEKDDKGKTIIRKLGMEPVQRDGLEYEFDVCGDLDLDNNLIIHKTRCAKLTGYVINKAGKEIADILTEWLNVAEPPRKESLPPAEQGTLHTVAKPDLAELPKQTPAPVSAKPPEPPKQETGKQLPKTEQTSSANGFPWYEGVFKGGMLGEAGKTPNHIAIKTKNGEHDLTFWSRPQVLKDYEDWTVLVNKPCRFQAEVTTKGEKTYKELKGLSFPDLLSKQPMNVPPPPQDDDVPVSWTN